MLRQRAGQGQAALDAFDQVRDDFAQARQEGKGLHSDEIQRQEPILTDALVQEGLAREVVRRINDARKEDNFSLSDRISVEYAASPRLAQVVSAFDDYVKAETLAVALNPGAADNGRSDEFDGETLKIVVKRV